MVDFFDTETGLPTEASDNPEADFLSGKISLDENQPVNFYDPITKKTIQSDVSKIMESLDLGLKFETDEQKQLREFKNDPANQGFIPTVTTFGKQLANQFLLGVPETAVDIAEGPDSIDYKKRQIEKEQNPVANFLGGATGFGLSLLYGGPVWKGVSKVGEVVAAPIEKLAAAGVAEAGLKKFATEAAANAVKYGTEGALLSVPDAISEAALGDHETTAEALLAGGEHILEGGLTGGALGVAGTTLARTLKAGGQIFDKVADSDALQGFADQKKLKAVGLKQREIEQIISGKTPNSLEDVANFLAEKDLSGFKALREGSEARLEKLQGIIKQSGQDLGKVYSILDDEGLKIFDPASANIGQKIETLSKSYGDAIDKPFQKQLADLSETLTSRGEQGPMTFKDAQQLVTKIGKYAFPKGLLAENMEAAQSVYRIVKDELAESVDIASKAIDRPDFAEFYNKTKKDLSIAKQLEEPFQKAFARQAGNNSISLTDYISAATVGGSTGSLPGALAGLVMNNLKRHYGDYITYKLLEGAAYGVDAMESRLNKALDNSLGLSKVSENIKPASVNLLRSYLGKNYNNQDDLQNLKAFQKDISAFINDSNASLGSLSLLTNKYQEVAPNLSGAMKAKAVSAVNYLAERMPKMNAPYSGLNGKTYRPSDMEVASFKRISQAVMDPLSVIEELKTGAVTTDQIDAIKTVYPGLFKAIQGKVLEKVNENPKLIPYAVKQKVFKLLELPGEGMEARQNIVQLQRNFRTNFTPTPKANSKITYGQRTTTDIDRVTYE